jgi:hypothetical protein
MFPEFFLCEPPAQSSFAVQTCLRIAVGSEPSRGRRLRAERRKDHAGVEHGAKATWQQSKDRFA